MKKSSTNYNWILKITIISFLISAIFTLISEISIPNVGIILGIILTLLFIFIGVLFDMIGVAVTTSDISKFHSMASKKLNNSKMAIKLKNNADKVSSFCNDVIGDICGIVSGSTGAVIAIKLSTLIDSNLLITTLITMGIISALTIGGKALEKGYAIKKSDVITLRFAKILNFFVRSK